MKYLVRIAMFALLLGLAGPAMAGSEDEIAALARAQSEAFDHGDIDTYMTVWADNAVLEPPGGIDPRAVGKQAIRASVVALFQASAARASVPRDSMIRFYSNGTVAVRNELRDESFTDRTGNVRTQKTRFTQVLVKSGDRWLVVEQHNSRVPPPPGPPQAN